MAPGSRSLLLDRRSVLSGTVPAPPSYLLMQATLKLSSETSVSPAIGKSEAASEGNRPWAKATRGSISQRVGASSTAARSQGRQVWEGLGGNQRESAAAQWFLEPVGGFYKFYS